jgi:hypothetical protein
MITLELDKEQSRKVTVEHIADTLIIQKQYLDDTQIAKYKFMLNEFAILVELDNIADRFDRAWPTDVKWS